MVTCRALYRVDQASIQCTEDLLIEYDPIVNLNVQRTGREPSHRLGKAFAGLAEEFRVKQTVHPPVQYSLLPCRRLGRQHSREKKPPSIRMTGKNVGVALTPRCSKRWLASMLWVALA